MACHQYFYLHGMRSFIVCKILLLFGYTGFAQSATESQYISGFRILSMSEVKIQNEENSVKSKYYYDRENLFKAKEYEKVIKAMDYATRSVNFNNADIFYQSYTSCLHLKKYNEALVIAQKGLSIKDNLGWRKPAKKRSYDYQDEFNYDGHVTDAILKAGQYKALMGMKKYGEAFNLCGSADSYLSLYEYIYDLRDFYFPIKYDKARLHMYKGEYTQAISVLEKCIDELKGSRKSWPSYRSTLDEIEKMAYSAICEINYLNNTPGNISSKTKKESIRDFSDHGDLIDLYNTGNYQGFVTGFTKIDDGNFTILYKYLALSYFKLGKKQESCAAFGKYRNSQDYRQPKVEPEVDEAEADACKQ